VARIGHADIVWPEAMTGKSTQLRDNRSNLRRRARRIRILGIADDANDAVLSEWTGCPVLLAICIEPAVRILMADMRRID
jgi:hypothetical protein